jgi:hypothetical protein
MTIRSLLATGLLSLTITISAAAQSCSGTMHSEERTCGCGGMAQLTTCQGLGESCENATGPNAQCTQTCFLINAGECLSARNHRADWFEAKSSLVPDPELLMANCGVKGQMRFTERLKNKLNEHNHRASLGIRNANNAL